MISEIDIRDWESIDTGDAFEALNNLVKNRPTVIEEAVSYAILFNLIYDVSLLQKKYVPQVAALFKEKNDGI